jgi:hypothetical protein
MSGSTVHYTLKRGPHGGDGLNTLDTPGGFACFTGDVYTFEPEDEEDGTRFTPLRETGFAPVQETFFVEFFHAEDTELPSCHLLIVVAHQTLRDATLSLEIPFEDPTDDPNVLAPVIETFEYPMEDALDLPDGKCCLRFLFLSGSVLGEGIEFPDVHLLNVSDGSKQGFPSSFKLKVGEDAEPLELRFIESMPELEVTDEFGVFDDRD